MLAPHKTHQLHQIHESPLRGSLVAALVYDGLCTFEFSIASEIFGLVRPEMGSNWYRFASVAVERGPLRAQGGLYVQAQAGMELLEQADLIVVPGWKGRNVPVPAELIQALLKAYRRGARLASICSGAFVLAATGLLDGKQAATHWRYAQDLASTYPAIEVDDKVLYVQSGRVYTSAGSAAGVDLMLHIVREEYGVEAANSVARRLVMPPHRNGGQAQFIERPVATDRNGRLADLLQLVQSDLKAEWSVQRLSQSVAMSTRTFIRRFVEATGQTPGDWVIGARVSEAKRLLESSVLSVETIAHQTGFGSVQTMRHHFRTQMGMAPKEYREMFSMAHSGKTPSNKERDFVASSG
jgi:AraC family transcriptional regulator, transcriptional activator FtrA